MTEGHPAVRWATIAAALAVGAAVPLAPAGADTGFVVQGAASDYAILQPLIHLRPADLPYMGRSYYNFTAPATEIVYPHSAGVTTCLTCPAVGPSVRQGQQTLDAQIKAAPPGQHITVVGQSEGSMVLNAEAESLANDLKAPRRGDVTFIVISDPQRGLLRYLPVGTYVPYPLDLTVTEPVDSPYDTVVVTAEYDIAADPPDRPWNLVADANAVLGFQQVHGKPAAFSDPADVPPENVTVTTNSKGAKVTSYLVPTKQLPLTKPLRKVLPNQIVDRIDTVARPIVDAGYSRHDDPNAPVKRPTFSRGTLHFGHERSVLPNKIVDRIDTALRPLAEAGHSRHHKPNAPVKRPILSHGGLHFGDE